MIVLGFVAIGLLLYGLHAVTGWWGVAAGVFGFLLLSSKYGEMPVSKDESVDKKKKTPPSKPVPSNPRRYMEVKRAGTYDPYEAATHDLDGSEQEQRIDRKYETVVHDQAISEQNKEVSTSIIFKDDPEADALLREATQWADVKNWDKAIACLKKTGDRAGLRLPLYLQKAGRFDEAMLEFERLLMNVKATANRDFAHQNKSGRTMLAHAEYQRIYDKMRVACKRQGIQDKAAEYEALSESHRKTHARLFKKEQELAAIKRDSKKKSSPPFAPSEPRLTISQSAALGYEKLKTKK